LQNKIVIRYLDGRILKGITSDFIQNKDLFHVVPMDAAVGSKPLDVFVKDLKAIFFVKDYAGDPGYQDKKAFEPNRPIPGRKIRVVFKDGEVMLGTTQGYQPGRSGFFIFPADPNTNTERCYVLSAAAQEVSFV